MKPTIELMEALPTVIIGFLAGLWLAPMIDEKPSKQCALFIAVSAAYCTGILYLVVGTQKGHQQYSKRAAPNHCSTDDHFLFVASSMGSTNH